MRGQMLCTGLSVTDCAHAAAGTASGTLLAVLGYVSLGQYKQGKLCKPVTVLSLLMSVALTVVMHQRWQKTGAIFPALTFMVVSGLMSVFYVWSLLMGPRPKSSAARA